MLLFFSHRSDPLPTCADMSAASVDLLDLQDAEGGRDPSDRKQLDSASLSSAGSADDEGGLVMQPASDRPADGIKSAPSFARISEEEKGFSDASSQEKGSDKRSTESQESDEERSLADRELAHSPCPPPAAAPPVRPKSPRPALSRMTAVRSAIKSSEKSCIKETATKNAVEEPFDDVEAQEKARVREGMQTILKTFSGTADPFAHIKSVPHDTHAPVQPSASLPQTDISSTIMPRLLPLKPAPERLLPIGPTRDPSPKPPATKSQVPHDNRDPTVTPVERLLPIGPSRDRSKSPAGAYKKLVSPIGTPDGIFFVPLPTCQPPPKPPRLYQLQQQQAEVIIAIESDVVKEETHKKSPPDEQKTSHHVLDSATVDAASATTLKDKHQDAGISEAQPVKESAKDEKADDVKEVSLETQRPSSDSKTKENKKKKRAKEGKGRKKKAGRPLPQEMEQQATLESQGHSISLDNLSETKPTAAGRQYKQRRQQRRDAQQSRSLDNNKSASCGGVAAGVQRRARKAEITSTSASSKRTSVSQASVAGVPTPGSDEGVIHQRCTKCSHVIEEFSEEEIGMCIVILRTYVHRNPELAAPLLPEMLNLVARFTSYFPNAWQYERFVISLSSRT